LPAELTFDLATGDIGVVADAPEGVYSFDYDICEPSTTNCDTATVTITVEALLLLPDINVVKSVLVYDPNNAFSNSATRPATFGECNYSPTAGDYDFAVTFICFNPKGAMLAGSSWLVRFRARIE